MSLSVEDLEFEEIPKNGIWMVSWVGDIEYISERDYQILVELTEVKDTSNLYEFEAFIPKKKDRKYVKLDVGLAFDIRIGMIWENGKPKRIHNRLEIEDNIHTIKNIDPDKSKITSIWDLADELDFFDCMSLEHPFSGEMGRANWVYVDLGDENSLEYNFLIIPCYEVVRRFFLVNDKITKNMLGGSGDMNGLFQEDSLDTDYEDSKLVGEIVFGDQIYVEDTQMKGTVEVLSFIAFDETAKECFWNLSADSFEYRKKGEKHAVKTGFPTKKPFSLKVNGKVFGSSPYKGLLVYEILSHGIKHPVDKVRYNIERRKDNRTVDGVDRETLKDAGTSRPISNHEGKNGEENYSVTSNNSPKTSSPSSFFGFEEEPLFEVSPETKRKKKEDQDYKGGVSNNTQKRSSKLSTQTRSGTDQETGKGRVEPHYKSDRLDRFIEVMKLVKEDIHRLDYKTINTNDGHTEEKIFSLFPYKIIRHGKYSDKNKEEKKEAYNWCRKWKIKKEGWTDYRRIAIVECVHKGKYVYAFEIEPRSKGDSYYTAFIRNKWGYKLNKQRINEDLLKKCAYAKGKWSEVEEDKLFRKDYKIKKAVHPKEFDKQKMAKRYLMKIKKLVG